MKRHFLIGVAVGSGLAARAAEAAGADFLLAVNSGRFRNMGVPSASGILPIADATGLTASFATNEVLSRSSVPVFLGVNVFGETADPQRLAEDVQRLGFQGVVNFPTSMHLTASMQHILERCGRGIASEVEVLAAAKARGLKTLFYCANRTQARLGADAGLDMILLNFGWNAGGSLGHRPQHSIDEAAVMTHEIGRLVKRIHPEAKLLLEGGPIVTAEDLARVVELADVDGYIGGSTIERLPMEGAVGDLIVSYREAGRGPVRARAAERRLLSWGRTLGAVGRSPALLDCLNQLAFLAPLAAPATIRHERGTDVSWVRAAFEGAARTTGLQVVRPGVEDRHGAARRRIFGSQRDGVSRIGALGDPSCTVLVIEHPELLSLSTQKRLARSLAEGRFTALGSRRQSPVHARCVFIAESWKDSEPPDSMDLQLANLVNAHIVKVPPLRARSEDIPDLLQRRFDELGLNPGRRPKLRPAALQRLRSHDWPDNDREFRALADDIADETGEIGPDRIAVALARGAGGGFDMVQNKDEKARIAEALWRNGYRRGQTAQALGISRKTLYNKIRRYGLFG